MKISLLPGIVLLLLLALPLPAVQAAAEENAQKVISFPLRGNPSTGYFWTWTATGGGAVRQTNVAYHQDRENLPGSPATYDYSFVGEKEGEVVLRFVYSRSEKGNPGDPVQEYRLKVLPDKRIVVLDK